MKRYRLKNHIARDMLGDRPLDPRVTYTTGISGGKNYPEIGNRQRERAERQRLRAVARLEDPKLDQIAADVVRAEY